VKRRSFAEIPEGECTHGSLGRCHYMNDSQWRPPSLISGLARAIPSKTATHARRLQSNLQFDHLPKYTEARGRGDQFSGTRQRRSHGHTHHQLFGAGNTVQGRPVSCSTPTRITTLWSSCTASTPSRPGEVRWHQENESSACHSPDRWNTECRPVDTNMCVP